MKSVRKDLIGQKFGRLTVISYAGTGANRRARWNCTCDCGGEAIIEGKNLLKGLTQSCGCIKKENMAKLNSSHGMSKSATYASYRSMLSRCYNKNQDCYDKYGAIGKVVCERWRDSFDNFLADMGERERGKTLDRINPFGNYSPENCRWATAKEQGINKRGSVAIKVLERLISSGAISASAIADYYTQAVSTDAPAQLKPMEATNHSEANPESAHLSAALNLRFDSDAGQDLTLRDYLRTLLTTVWEEGECFSGKRPFGNSGWEYDLYRPLIKAGFIGGKLDEKGSIEELNEQQGNLFIKQLIIAAFGGV